jgi:hypothetical protein
MDTALPWMIIALLVLGIGVGTTRGSGVKALEFRLRRVERKLDLMLDQLGVRDPESGLAAELEALLRQGKKIAAVKRYREATGAGLKEAKNEVDRMLRGDDIRS